MGGMYLPSFPNLLPPFFLHSCAQSQTTPALYPRAMKRLRVKRIRDRVPSFGGERSSSAPSTWVSQTSLLQPQILFFPLRKKNHQHPWISCRTPYYYVYTFEFVRFLHITLLLDALNNLKCNLLPTGTSLLLLQIPPDINRKPSVVQPAELQVGTSLKCALQ
jgi:hypothetical protein